jgi:hypothetical protein
MSHFEIIAVFEGRTKTLLVFHQNLSFLSVPENILCED